MKNLYVLIAISFVIFSSSLNAQWVQTNGPYGYVHSFAISPDLSGNLFAGTVGGTIFRSTDNGTSWTAVFAGTYVDALATSDTNIFAGTDGGVFRSTNNGTTWTAAGLTNNVYPQALAISDTNLFAGTYQSGVFRSTNNGISWTSVNSGLVGDALKITALFVSDTNLFAGTWGGGVFHSTNNGTTWVAASNGLTSNNVHAFTISGTNLFAGTYFGSGVYLSTNNGTSWTAVNNGLTNSNVRALAVSGANLFAGTDGGGVFLSTNNGISWTAVNTGLTNIVVNALLISGTNLFAGTNDGVWRRSLSEMILPVEITTFTAAANGKEVILNWVTATEINNRGFEIQRKVAEGDFAAVGFIKGEGTSTNQKEYSYADKDLADGKYFYRLKQLDFSGESEFSKTIEVDVRSLNNFTLEQNYPNPFNPSTKINWQSPISSWQVLKVFDVLGNEVATLVNEFKPAGSYEVEFNAANLPSGVYLYKLQAGSFVETKKLMLLK